MAGNEFADALEEIRSYTAQVRQATEDVKAEAAAERAKRAESDDQIAKERRAGTHGRDWQVLQERIDLKRTTESDILSGVDHSPEAEAVRRVAQRGLVEGREVGLAAIEESSESGQLEDLKRAQAELARLVAQLGQFRGDL